MRSVMRCALVLGLVCLCMATAVAQRRGRGGEPHIGYAYPAGACRGTTVEVTVGGQHLRGVNAAQVSGDGIQVEVVQYYAALTKPASVKLFQMLRAYREQNKDRFPRFRRNRQRANGTPAEADKNKANAKKQPADKAGTSGRKKGKATETEGPVTAASIVEKAKSYGLEVDNIFDIVAMLRTLRDPKRQPNEQLGERAILKITVSPDATPGTRRLRLTTPGGTSNAVVFQVGRYPEVTEVEPNDVTPKAEPLTELPVVLNGQILPGDVDRFTFKATRGTKLVAAVSARSLVPYMADAVPGWFQATLKLTDARGRQVAFCDDYRFDPDPVLHYEVPTDGLYTLEIADSIYRGREDFVYRVVLGEVPFITGIYPLGGPAGRETTVQLSGWNLPTDKLTVKPPADGCTRVPVSVADGINTVPFAVGRFPETVERGDRAGLAAGVTMPTTVNGRVDRPGDWDVYRLHLDRGETVVVEVEARRLGSPIDSLVKLTDEGGRILAAADDHENRGDGLVTHHADSRLTYTPETAGTVLVHVGDIQHAGGFAYAYRLTLRRPQPDFELRMVPANINAGPGAVVPVTVHAIRHDGFDDEILLQPKDLPSGYSLSGGCIPAGADTVRVTLAVPRPFGRNPVKESSFRLRLEGVAGIDGKAVRHEAVPAEDLMQAFLWRHLVAMDDSVVTVGGRRRWVPPIRYSQSPVKLTPGGTATVALQGPRVLASGRFEIALDDPPAGLSIKQTRYDPKRGMVLTLSADGELAKADTAGNLIFSLFAKPRPRKDGKPAGRSRFPLGVLPALPYEVGGEH
ncbi:MAG: hypothetical protein ACOCXX_00360 [Planctomycetota bacterium]